VSGQSNADKLPGNEILQTYEKSLELSARGAYAESEALVEAALAEHPDSPFLLVAMGDALIARAESDPEVRDIARNHLMRAQELAPDDPHVAYRAGEVLLTLDYIDEARAAVELATELVDDTFTWPAALAYLRGRILVIDGNLEEGERSLTAAFELDPEQDGLRHLLSRLRAELGDNTDSPA
jgi:predicted Zn-dependent protease